MASAGGHEPVEYMIEHLRDALARDPRTNELDVQVTIVEGHVFLTGFAGIDTHRDAISEIAREVLPDHQVHNDMTVTAPASPDGAEQLS